MLQLRSPSTNDDFDRYYDLRWRVLREPWGQPRGSERDTFDETGVHVIAEDQSGKLIGTGCLHFSRPDEARIRYMAVEDFARGRGVGRAMVEWLEEKAIQKNAIAVVLNSREAAVGFYEHLGYAVVATGETLFGEIKHFKMQKKITPGK